MTTGFIDDFITTGYIDRDLCGKGLALNKLSSANRQTHGNCKMSIIIPRRHDYQTAIFELKAKPARRIHAYAEVM